MRIAGIVGFRQQGAGFEQGACSDCCLPPGLGGWDVLFAAQGSGWGCTFRTWGWDQASDMNV